MLQAALCQQGPTTPRSATGNVRTGIRIHQIQLSDAEWAILKDLEAVIDDFGPATATDTSRYISKPD